MAGLSGVAVAQCHRPRHGRQVGTGNPVPARRRSRVRAGSGRDEGADAQGEVALDGKPVSYSAAVAKLAPGVIHLVALAKIPGLMPNMSDDHLWAELTGPRYTTPLLRSWIPWLKETMTNGGGIVVANGFRATVGVLKTEPDALDESLSQGVREGYLSMVA